MKYKMKIAYDGTDYAGWQVQPHAPSVAQTMQDVFFRLFNQKIKLIGASRTDAGVHALEQIAVCTVDFAIDASTLMNAWNDALPGAIVIRSLEAVADDFHPIYGVAEKEYWYHFFLERPLPFVERYGWYFRHALDQERLQEFLDIFIGTHDFRSFCTGTDMGENTVRTINSIQVTMHEFNAWRIAFKGPGFMRHMIRRIVGASMQAASQDKISPERMHEILLEKNPKQTLFTAPAKGLCLARIQYRS